MQLCYDLSVKILKRGFLNEKILSLILAFTMILFTLPFGTITISAVVHGYTSGTTGECNWSIEENVLTISGNGAMEISSLGYIQPWSEVTKIIIENGVTNIGDYVFFNCVSLTDITIPESVTNIGPGAFYNCRSLTSITIPDSVTSVGGLAGQKHF